MFTHSIQNRLEWGTHRAIWCAARLEIARHKLSSSKLRLTVTHSSQKRLEWGTRGTRTEQHDSSPAGHGACRPPSPAVKGGSFESPLFFLKLGEVEQGERERDENRSGDCEIDWQLVVAAWLIGVEPDVRRILRIVANEARGSCWISLSCFVDAIAQGCLAIAVDGGDDDLPVGFESHLEARGPKPLSTLGDLHNFTTAHAGHRGRPVPYYGRLFPEEWKRERERRHSEEECGDGKNRDSDTGIALHSISLMCFVR